MHHRPLLPTSNHPLLALPYASVATARADGALAFIAAYLAALGGGLYLLLLCLLRPAQTDSDA